MGGSKFERLAWRKLFCIERGPFAALPLYARALAAELLKFTDDEGRLWVGEGDPVPSLARRLGADTSDRRLLRQHIPMLLADGYLVREGGYLVIRNQVEAQSGPRPGRPPGPSSPTKDRGEPTTNRSECEANQQRTGTNETRVDNESSTNFDLSARNHSGEVANSAETSRTRVLRKDKIREEGENPPSPLEGEKPPRDQGKTTPEPSTSTRPVAEPEPAPPTPRSAGLPPTSAPASQAPASSRLAAAWAQGVRAATGRPCTVPAQRWHLEALARCTAAHGPEAPDAAVDWLAASAERFVAAQLAAPGASGQPPSLTPERWETWLNAGQDAGAVDPLPPFEELSEDLIPPPRWGQPPARSSTLSTPAATPGGLP